MEYKGLSFKDMANLMAVELRKAQEHADDRISADAKRWEGQGTPAFTASVWANVDERLSAHGIAVLKVIEANNKAISNYLSSR